MEALIVEGGKQLNGAVRIGGAKNAVLPLLAATVIRSGSYSLHNCPNIADVELAAEIIRSLGGKTERQGDCLQVDTEGVNRWKIPGELMAKMRASVLFLGPLLARFGRAEMTMPGGCPLGRRPIDLHLDAMTRMGATVTMADEVISCVAPRLRGCTVEFSFPSVGATENALLAAMGCGETVILKGAAREPEIGDLIGFLQSLGAEISGEGTDTLIVHRGTLQNRGTYRVMADRMEAATCLCAAAACGGSVCAEGIDGMLLLPVLLTLGEAGCEILLGSDRICLQSEGLRSVSQIRTAPYPGFPTDAQAPMMAALLRAAGESRFTETIFDSRFGHVPSLRQFGADIQTAGPTAVVRGVRSLCPAAVEACDLRAAAALVIAALQTEGKSVITGLKHLDRGYDDLEGKLRKLGADIFRQNRTFVDSDWKFLL